MKIEIRKILFLIVTCTFVFGLGACSTSKWLQDENNDPFEPVNRAVFKFNQGVDDVLLEPAARTYRFVLPEFARNRVHNVLENLKTPATFANDVLQGQIKKSGVILTRFALNSTVGILGMFDVASKVGLKPHTEDFGQTLSVWGVGEGPYMVVPLLGPSSPRALVGKVADVVMNPFDLYPYTSDADDDTLTAYAALKTGLSTLDKRERSLELLDDLQSGSVDFYTSVRSMYRQNRKNAVYNSEHGGNKVTPAAYDFDFPDDDYSYE